MSSEILGFYFLFWWFIQIFYKITSLDQRDCRIKTYLARKKSQPLRFGLLDGVSLGFFIGSFIKFTQEDLFLGSLFWIVALILGARHIFISWKKPIDALYKMVSCQLCMESHLGFIISIPIAFFYQDYRLLLLGYSAAGFNNIIKRIMNE